MKLTLGTTYYNCPELLNKFIDHPNVLFLEGNYDWSSS